MEKRNAIFLMIIIAATLLVTVVETSFAFSATTMKKNANTVDKANSEISASSLITSYDKNIEVNLNGLDDSVLTNTAISDSSNIFVKLSSLSEQEFTKCTYDIIFVWTSTPQQELEINDNTIQDKYYIRTATVSKELTLSGNANIVSSDEKGAVGTTIQQIPEKNIDEYSLRTKKDISRNEVLDYFVLVDDAVITSTSVKKPTEVMWNFEMKFYYVNKDQVHLKDKTYGGYISVDENSIRCY